MLDMNSLEVINAEQCAALLQCEPDHVEHLTRRGELPGVKIGRGWIFVRADLLAYLAERARQEADSRRLDLADKNRSSVVAPIKSRRRTPPPLPAPLPGSLSLR